MHILLSIDKKLCFRYQQ